MSRLYTTTFENATGEAAELFSQIKSKMGKVPNAYLTIGSNSPQLLGLALQHNLALASSSLKAQELEAINLAVSEATGCDYCLAAHTMLGKMAGFSKEQMQKLRKGSYDESEKLNSLVNFVNQVVKTRGTLPVSAIESLRNAGYNDRQVVEIISAISAIYFTNTINRVNDTVVDFPKAD